MRHETTKSVMFGVVAVLLFSLAIAPSPLCGQALFGSINGTVTDPGGAAVAGATVTIIDVAKGTKEITKTNVDGNYLVQHLIPDLYKVRVEATGFSIAESEQFQLSADTSPRIDIQLKIGSLSQTVEVSAGAPQLKTDRADVATLLDTRSIIDLPNLTRNATSMVILAPGTSASTFNNAVGENPQQSTPISANGQVAFSTGFVLDGANNKDSFIGEVIINPPLDSIAEMKFVSQNYDAEFGAAVAGVVVAQTKSGSNNFHGSAFEYRYSDATQATDPFTQYPGANAVGSRLPPSMYNLFGGSVGGPVRKNRIFFFGDYQGQRQKAGSSFIETVPTALVHQTCVGGASGNCDLSQYLAQGQVYNPNSGNADGSGRTAYAGNLIPNSEISPQAVYLLKLLPLPTLPGIANNYVASGSGLFNDNQFDTRIDAQVRNNLHVFGRYGFLDAVISSPGSFGDAGGGGFFLGGFAGSSKARNQSLAVGADLGVSPTLITDFRFTYFRYRVLQDKYNAGVLLEQNAGIPGINTGAYGSDGASGFSVDGLTSFGSGNHGQNHCNCPLDETEQEYSLVNNWTKVVKNHAIKFGAEVRFLNELRIPSDNSRAGEMSFALSRTASLNAANSGLGLATYLMGDVTSFTRYFTPTATNPAEHQKRIFFYVQDNWRISQKLTLNLGVRWEGYTPEAVDGKGLGAYYDAQTNNIRVAGYGGIGMNLNVEGRWTYFLPRVGLAYQLTPKTVLRGGFGRSLDPGFWGAIFGQGITQTYPVLQTQGLYASSNYTRVFSLAAGPPAPATSITVPSNGLIPLPSLDDAIAPTTRTNQITLSQVDGWNATIQRQLTPTLSFQAGYVGNHGSNMGAGSAWAGEDWNVYTIKGGPLTKNLSICQRSVYYERFGSCFQGGAGWLTAFAQNDHSDYHSLQIVLDKTFSSGMQAQASYVYSHSSGHGGWQYNEIDQSVMQGPFDMNRQSSFKLFGNYNLPFGKGGLLEKKVPTAVNKILGGIAINGTMILASGLPYSLGLNNCSLEQDGSWTTPCRPDLTGSFSQGSNVTHGVGYVQWFTPVSTVLSNPGQSSGSFRAPAIETFGNSGYNGEFGPGLFTTDLSLTKSFSFAEKAKIQLLVIAQNAFNHPNWGNPNGCVDCATSGGGQIFGLLGGVGMRQLEFAARVTF